MDGAIHLRQTIPTSRPPRISQRSRPRSAAAGHASSICRPHLDPLVSRRVRRRTRAPQVVYVSRTRPRERYLLVICVHEKYVAESLQETEKLLLGFGLTTHK